MEREGWSFNPLVSVDRKFLNKSRNLLWNKVAPEDRLLDHKGNRTVFPLHWKHSD